MSVKVGVRVRPFNKRQIELECRRCVQMQKETTRLIDSQGNVKNFVYDYSFWSHDKFMVDPDGIFIPVDDKYADQQRVYREIGSDILVNAWQGYNCCLFAYGQTGSGKSYSMIGYGPNKGVIPIVCDQIFKKIKSNTNEKVTFQVMVSMMQIYNESVRDLLQKNKSKQLKICQSKKLGVYVQGLYKHPVSSYEQIAKKIQQGSNNRSIAATLMNESSSRSHTIVSINFIQKIQVTAAQTSVKYSVIHLVDLAGSQCVAKTGVDSKDRLRQTAKINQSLSTLGRVIQILAQNSSKVDKTFVPYRDSKLTFILRNALGGNSRTAMICAISPADDNYEQTLSTLRYASRAKKIQNKAIINQSDVDKLIRMLRQQNQMLKKMLQEAKFTKTVINQEVISNYNHMSQNMVELGIMKRQQEELLLDDIDQDEKQRLQLEQNGVKRQENESIIMQGNQQKVIKGPYITNISQDQLLSFRVKYSCEQLLIGNKYGNPKPDVVLAALGIQPRHAKISVSKDKIEGQQAQRVFLQILCQEAQDYTYINGQNVTYGAKQQLFDNDRLIFGTGCIFLVIVPGGKQRGQGELKIQDIDYQFAIKQMQNLNLQRSRIMGGQSQEQLRKKIVSEVQKQYEQIKRSNEQNLKKQIQSQQRQYKQKLEQLSKEKQEQTEKLKRQLQNKLKQALSLQDEKRKVQDEIQNYRKMQREMEEAMLNKVKQDQERQKKQGNQDGDNENGDKQETKQKQRDSQSINKQQEQRLQETNRILLLKIAQIAQLQSKIGQINQQNAKKQDQIKQQIQKQEQMVQKQLQLKTIMCQNQNILTQYRLQLSKRLKNAKELRQLLVKKEKAFLQKQLIQLVPMVQRFNLMAKQMKRRVQAGLSVQYKYISQAQIVDALKNNAYKSKLKILIHVINKQENRGYYWSTQIFKNRYQHAIQVFQSFISQNVNVQTIDKYKDPYWEPETFQIVGMGCVSLQCLLYKFRYDGKVTLVNLGTKVGELTISLDPQVQQNKSTIQSTIKPSQPQQQIKIFNPRDLIQRSLSFQVSIKQVQIQSGLQIQKLKIQYELLQSNYKVRKYQTPQINFNDIGTFQYNKIHTISDISQNTILHYTDRPVTFSVLGIVRLRQTDQLTCRDSFASSKVSSFIGTGSSFHREPQSSNRQGNYGANDDDINITSFTQVAKPDNLTSIPQRKMTKAKTGGAIVDNLQILSKIQNDYARKKRQSAEQLTRSAIQRKHSDQLDRKRKKKDDNCQIF